MRIAHFTLILLLCACAHQLGAQAHRQAVELDEARMALPPPRRPRYDSTLLHSNLLRIKEIATQQRQFHDSTAVEVLERMPWQSMCVVTDWTASMYSHDAMLIRWHLDRINAGRIGHLCLFNDGDGKYDDEKEIGLTGGIYHCGGADSLGLWQAITGATLGGNGGDHRENVLEALLEGIWACPDCSEIVLVADNVAPIRDFSLLPEIDRPVRVVLFGVYKDGVNADYLNLAYRTHGSLHTRNHDVEDIGQLLLHGSLALEGQVYELREGNFVKVKEGK